MTQATEKKVVKGRGRKASVQQADLTVKPEFEDSTLCNVARVPRLLDGKQEVSAKGSPLWNTICFPVTMSVKVIKSPDVTKYSIELDGVAHSIEDSMAFAIGLACLKDTTTKLTYVSKNMDKSAALNDDARHTILKRCKRLSTVKRTKVLCKLLNSIIATPTLSDAFSADEKAELYNALATRVMKLKAIFDDAPKAKKNEQYFAVIA